MEEHNLLPAGKLTFEALAEAALDPGRTDELFGRYEGLFVEVCARWISESRNSEAKIAAFGRIIPLAPYLAEHLERFLISVSQSPIFGAPKSNSAQETGAKKDESGLCQALLGTFRLLSLDCRNFAKHVRPLALESLFQHPSKAVRYLAIRTFCLYVHAADFATQQMVTRYVGEGEIQGEWEGQTMDYRFLALWEEKRWSLLQSRLQKRTAETAEPTTPKLLQQLSPYTVHVNGVLLPRLDGAPSKEKPSDLISTSTTESNLSKMATGLLGSSPLLLVGLAGSGKTLLTRHFAWQLNKLDSMVTLHLNEQSDAKLLVGMYATGATPGTFSWRAGVLTTAVKEGRWIFIEDLDRAPNEVISTLLPLIERGELLIPSRGETIKASRGFRIIATMRSTLNQRGQEIVPRQNMIGHRFWNSINIQMPQLVEFEQVITTKYLALRKHVPGIMRVYSRLLELFSDPKFSSENGTSLRALTPRDLLKWCDRIVVLLALSTSFNTAQMDDIFMEAKDCFAGSLRSDETRLKVMACVAEELHIDPQRRDHLLVNREVKLELPSKSTASGTIRIGRARLSKHKASRKPVSGRPFSTNDYTLRLLEKVAVAANQQEPLLLVGETGTGKTTCIQYLAEQLGRKLVAFNLSQQSESGDLLGGYKPVNIRSLVIPLKDEFDDLFDTTFSRKKNLQFMELLGKRVAKGEWKRVCMLWREALKKVDAARKSHESRASSPDPDGGQPKKKRKVDSLPSNFPEARWEKFAADVGDLEAQLASGSQAFAFSFLEGNIVKAVRNGDWVLLDEINLASSDTLEALADLLGGGPDGTPSILLTETGNVERVVAHPNFRVFAAMNPATDVGKKDLPPGIRSRFTEIYVESPDNDTKSLRSIVEKYLGGESRDPTILRISLDVTNLYLDIQRMAKSNMLVDGADQKAHFSLRTLTRTLSYAREIAPLCTLRRALYEGFHMSFLTFLGKTSEDLVAPLILQHLFPQKSNMKAELGRALQQPTDHRSYVREGHYWLRQGLYPVESQDHYIVTPFVQRNLNNLIRASSTRRYPVLIQGPTSSGKTSMIEYLAKRSGNKFVRINNHEHTDLQEYLGSYISGTDGKLRFQEGVLVRALREGHWIVLDELNLAPTDVLEALNRLLDDNRELLIPETQEVVRPHEDFMLFATQNPAGLYGGRKVLSRAFRNRFLELHFDDIPVEELTEILSRRTQIPETWCKKIVNVYKELSTLRQENRLFEQKSFATLRDLFRWAQRKAETVDDLAMNGYMLLAERVRKEEERNAIKKIIEKVMSKGSVRVTIDETAMYGEAGSPEILLYKDKIVDNGDVVWTSAMRRLYVLVAHAIRNNEPVLLVGETGCGKTTVCQMLADAFEKQLHIVNAHQNTETGDLIGAQRPIRNRAGIEDLLRRQLFSVLENSENDTDLVLDLESLLKKYDALDEATRDAILPEHRDEIQVNRIKATALFEWADGSLVHAMKTAQFFLLDEISLADDSVLERLNSVLESSRTLLLAEKGPIDSFIIASEGFQFLATMNPGGDYGKKELSPALRNRFTEIWVPALSDVDDIMQIVQSKLKSGVSQHAGCIVSFAQWFNEKYNTSVASSISIRDTLAWVTFINNSPTDEPNFGIVHGAAMVFIDTLGANPAGLLAIPQASINEERNACLHRLSKLLGEDISPLYFNTSRVVATDQSLQFGPFSIPKFSQAATEDISFSLEAPTTRSNAMRIVRALQLSKPILIEGNPGVGKTTLITAIAKATGKPLTRLNLSEQTDLMDLFGSDVPVEGGQAGTFAWRDAPFLKAMKNGDWVLLDEMNLASQSVLEGLNAVLDHRGEVYISELDQTFQKHPDFRVFAAQNPHHQGGGRKGLPASFVNRFTVVYADVFRPEDLSMICAKVYPGIQETEVKKLIDFVSALDDQVATRRTFGTLGAPWEFNLRDTLRWLQLLAHKDTTGSARDFLDTVFVQRFRTEVDRTRLYKLFESVYGGHESRMSLYHDLGHNALQVGLSTLSRNTITTRPEQAPQLQVSQLGSMEALMVSVQHGWPVILVGPPGSGKTKILSQLASFVGTSLVNFSMNADIDAMDLVGGYEQVDFTREIHQFVQKLNAFLREQISSSSTPLTFLLSLLEDLETHSTPDLVSIDHHLQGICQDDTLASLAIPLLMDVKQLRAAPHQIEGARFQWVDGILIRALEQGTWLVLDNANLCSSAVLDRLNSLLEPNGYLSINEHSTEDGEARIVRPHKDFRIFLTVDPRFGELSRAMRNRAVEICLLPGEGDVDVATEMVRTPTYPLEWKMYRFRHFMHDEESLEDTVNVRYEHLSPTDTGLVASFNATSSKGLMLSQHATGLIGQGMSNGVVSRTNLDENGTRFSKFLTDIWDPKARNLESQLMREALEIGKSKDLLLQPYHPLNNEVVLHLSPSFESLSFWYASMYEILLDLYNMQHAMQTLPSTRFERRREKQKLPAFLNAFSRSLSKCVETTWVAHLSHVENPSLKALRVLFWAFLELANTPGFDRATFQTYLKMLNTEIMSFTEPLSVLGTTLSKELTAFGSEVQLRTGLSMERIWRHFKPDTPKTIVQLSAILNLESLADRLDEAMWKSNLKIDEMIQIRERFASSLQLVKTQDVQAAELITTLAHAVQELEERTGEEDTSITPYFEAEFEGLCQFLDITQSHRTHHIRYHADISQALRVTRAKSSLLARRPTKSAVTEITYKPSQFFTILSLFVGTEKEVGREMVLKERFHVALLDKMRGADEVQLTQLDRFESELLVLSQQVSLDSERITRDQYEALSDSYVNRVSDLLASHWDVITMATNPLDGFVFNPDTPISDLYRQALEQPLLRLKPGQAPVRGPQESQAWVDLALAGLSLYVPNYPYDPALRPMIERKLFNEKKFALTQKLISFRQFQVGFTGQETSLRIRRTEDEIREMGTEPPVPAIVRPEISELDALQGEFTNLLSVIQPLLNGTITAEEASQDQTLRQNIAHIIRRLVGGYRSYDDITAPAVGFLVCLNIGLTLGARDQVPESNVSRSLKYITQHTPFFGLSSWYSTPDAGTLVQYCEQELAQSHHAVDLRWHALHSLAVMKGIDSGVLSKANVRGLVQNLFSSFYTEWKNKLLQDQEREAKDKSLYTYKGDEEDEDEADEELFPDFEKEEDNAEQVPVVSSASNSREQAIRLANMHAEILLRVSEPSDSLKTLLEWSSAQMVRVAQGESHGTNQESALPAIFLSLGKKSDALVSSGTSTGKAYNFYFDANIPEAKRLIALVHQIQHRYRQIRKVWPEHATLMDVLRTCDEALAFRHVDPVAKFITKSEKLHGYIYEWQRVASKEFSTADLYDNLTKLLVSWRQLELTTWARLFDIEMEKCRDDAKSWFFIAYETIVAASESAQDEKSMDIHAKELLKTLESFFSSTSLGQFQQRIKLLAQLRAHIGMRMQDTPALTPMHLALSNFIAYFARLEKPVHDAITKGRAALEQKVSEVIKLASWKDTNIEALKQSAKTSHRKLSKLVRKFRTLLKQPVSGIYGAGFPDGNEIAGAVVMESVGTVVDPIALEVCEKTLPGWTETPTRFKNLSATVKIMRKKATPSEEGVDGSEYIESFIKDLETTMAELQKATPTTLTEENKETIGHLKAQKRKLYADTLKALRQMGFRPNLAENVIDKQEELSTVLATLPAISGESTELTRGAELFLHKTLSIMGQIRYIHKEHSGDLTGNDVAKSIGFLEGILWSSIRQRGLLGNAIQALEELRVPTEHVANLCTPGMEDITSIPVERVAGSTTMHEKISWLSAILKTGGDVTTAQAKLGKTNEFDVVTQGLRDWSTQFRNLADAFDRLPALPQNVWLDAHKTWDETVRQQLEEFRSAFMTWMNENPLPRAILKQIQPYIFDAPRLSVGVFSNKTRINVEAQSKAIFDALDLILGSMQDVETALNDIPSSIEDATWFVKEEQAISAAITALYSPQITTTLQTIVRNMHHLYENENLRAISALFAAIQPILTQYITTHIFLLSKFSALHFSTTKLLHRLAKSFLQIGTQGFCTPSEKSKENQGKDDKLESGTGLGEGEGAEDISKDIEDDEDLGDLAQEEKGEREGSIEDEEDAVDMGEQDMEGEMGETKEKEEDGSGDEGDEDVQSEVGSVDDLGPSAVDEKMWDDGGKEEEGEDREGKNDVGTEKEEGAAAEEKEKGKDDKGDDGDEDKKEEGEEEMEMEGEDQEENVGVGETEKMDPHAKEEETLDLPEELNIDGMEDDKQDDIGDMDMDDEGEEEMEPEPGAEPDTVDNDVGPEQEGEEETDTTGHVPDDEKMDEDQGEESEGEDEGEEPVDDDAIPMPDEQVPEESRKDDNDNHADANAEAGAGIDANEEAHQDQKEQTSSSAANREDGDQGETSGEQQESTAEDGALGQTAQPDASGTGEDAEDSPETQSFKKIGDTLEKWYNQQRQISDAKKKDETQVQQIDKEVDMANAEFEHLPDEETQADTQALGTATEEQAKTLDHDMAMTVDEDEKTAVAPVEEDEEIQNPDRDVEMEDVAPEQDQDSELPQNNADGRPQAFIGEQKPFTTHEQEDEDMEDAIPLEDDMSDTSSVDEVDMRLEATHLDPSSLITPEAARALWLSHEASTHALSQQLTEHLRLILAPTLATKLRGDFRTGKRLNLKRIIPYIASGYKRDKIWLRRSQPSKRSYQVMIALDDSRSMAESGTSGLALKTLTLVSRALAMLEVGEVSIVGFGDTVNVAHDFDKPFTSEAGAKVFSQFGFEDTKTNVRGLVDKALGLFEEARQRQRAGGEELWQLMLIVSDGICDGHEEIRRLVRRAREERVMIVFVIVDSSTTPDQTSAQSGSSTTTHTTTAGPATATSSVDGTVATPTQPQKTSILDLQSVEIADGKVVRWKYMDRFPFRYYLVVRDVRELPNVLAGALRQWFAEVSGSG
jgi:midasin